MKLMYGIALATLLAGCGGQAELRSVSAGSANMLTSYSNSLRDFAAGQSVLNAETEARIQRFEGMRLEREAEVGARVDTWKYLDDETALNRFAVLGTIDADDLIAAATPHLPPAQPAAALKFDTGEVGQLVKGLVELQKPLTLEQQIAHFEAYGATVREAFNEDLEDASSDTNQANAVAQAGEASVQATAEAPKS